MYELQDARIILNATYCRSEIFENTASRMQPLLLKVLTNEKRGGLKVVPFDRLPFKLITLRFLNKSV